MSGLQPKLGTHNPHYLVQAAPAHCINVYGYNIYVYMHFDAHESHQLKSRQHLRIVCLWV